MNIGNKHDRPSYTTIKSNDLITIHTRTKIGRMLGDLLLPHYIFEKSNLERIGRDKNAYFFF